MVWGQGYPEPSKLKFLCKLLIYADKPRCVRPQRSGAAGMRQRATRKNRRAKSNRAAPKEPQAPMSPMAYHVRARHLKETAEQGEAGEPQVTRKEAQSRQSRWAEPGCKGRLLNHQPEASGEGPEAKEEEQGAREAGTEGQPHRKEPPPPPGRGWRRGK